MSSDDTWEQLAAVARAETAARYRRPRRASVPTPAAAVEPGTGPADPRVLAALVDALSPVRPVPGVSSRVLIEQLIARGTPEGRIARVAGVQVDEVRAVRDRMDELSA